MRHRSYCAGCVSELQNSVAANGIGLEFGGRAFPNSAVILHLKEEGYFEIV